MYFLPCEIHNKNIGLCTSPTFRDAVSNGKKVHKNEKRIITVHFSRGVTSWIVDVDFFKQFFPDEENDFVTLYERNRELKQLNDRIMVVKIRKELSWACPACLESIFYEDEF